MTASQFLHQQHLLGKRSPWHLQDDELCCDDERALQIFEDSFLDWIFTELRKENKYKQIPRIGGFLEHKCKQISGMGFRALGSSTIMPRFLVI